MMMKITSPLLGLLLSFSIINAQYTLTDDDVVVTAGVITICSYDFAQTSIIIPATLDGQTVTGIGSDVFVGSGVFEGKGITSVQLPGSLQNIGVRAFRSNSITSLDLSSCPDLQIIGESAFQLNSISNIVLSASTSLKSIGNYAFAGTAISLLDLSSCTALQTIGEHAFMESNIATLNLSSCTALQTIGTLAFYDNSITSVDFSNCTSLQSIGYQAFRYNVITSIKLSSCPVLQYIGEGAFFNNSLSSFTLPAPVIPGFYFEHWQDAAGNTYPANGVVTDFATSYSALQLYILKDNDVVVTAGKITSCSYDFSHADIIIPANLDGQTVIEIGEYTFQNKGITYLRLPGSLQTIGDFAFSYNFIPSLDLSSCTSLQTIEYRAFNANSLSSIDLSSCTALHYIGELAFYGNSIPEFSLPTPEISGYVFQNWEDADGSVYPGNSVVSDFRSSYTAILVLPALPVVTTQAVSDITGTSATGNGTITNLGAPDPIQHGICWNTAGTPDITDNLTEEGTVDVTGAFISGITGLVECTRYYVRAYATNTEGTVYGDETSFTTNDETSPVPDVANLPAITAECEVSTLSAPTATDNCAGSITGTHNATLPVTMQGTTVVTWTYDDGNGNTSTQTQNVVIDDVTSPVPGVANLPDITAECEVSTLSAPTATDNCAGSITGTHNATLPVTMQGTTVVTWTFDDGNGNTSTQTQNVIISDITNPTISCIGNQDITIGADESYYIINGTEFDPLGSDDNCAVAVVANNLNNASSLAGSELIMGTTTISWTVTDEAGNIATCSFDIVINQATGVTRFAAEAGFNIYPNPAENYIVISGETILRSQKIEIVDLAGKVVKLIVPAAGKREHTIQVGDLQNGMYFIKANNHSGILVKR